MNPWRALILNAPRLADKLRATGCPKLRLVVDGRPAYWALLVPRESDLEAHSRFPGMPAPSLEGWLVETLERFERGWPEAGEVELLSFWPPDRLEAFARVRPRQAVGRVCRPSRPIC